MADLVKLDKVINDLESQSRDLLEVNQLLSQVATLKNELEQSLVMLSANNKSFDSFTEILKISITRSLEQLAIKVDELYEDNKKFHKGIDSLLHSLLEKHKSDIQVEIRNEGQHLKTAFGDSHSSIEKKIRELEVIFIKTSNHSSKKNSFLIGLAVIILGSNIFLVTKLMGIL